MAGSQFCLIGSDWLRNGSVFVRAFQIEALPIEFTSLVRGLPPMRGVLFRTVQASALIENIFVRTETYDALLTKILAEKRKLFPLRANFSLIERAFAPAGRHVVLIARIPFLPRGLSPLHADFVLTERI
jgi:hypothetical protein